MPLITSDGLRPDLVRDDARHGIALSGLRSIFMTERAWPEAGMTSVAPTLTHPNREGLITGTYPAAHEFVADLPEMTASR